MSPNELQKWDSSDLVAFVRRWDQRTWSPQPSEDPSHEAVVYTRYGSPEVLRFTDVEKPAPKDNEVLVKVQAVSLNRSDWEALRGKPLYARLMGPLRPRHHILGSDIAGRVEAAGPTAASTCRLPSDQNAIARRSRWSPSNSAAVMSSAA